MEYGPHKSLCNRLKRWNKISEFARIMAGLAAQGTATKTIMIEATYLTAHHTASSLRESQADQKSIRGTNFPPNWGAVARSIIRKAA